MRLVIVWVAIGILVPCISCRKVLICQEYPVPAPYSSSSAGYDSQVGQSRGYPPALQDHRERSSPGIDHDSLRSGRSYGFSPKPEAFTFSIPSPVLSSSDSSSSSYDDDKQPEKEERQQESEEVEEEESHGDERVAHGPAAFPHPFRKKKDKDKGKDDGKSSGNHNNNDVKVEQNQKSVVYG